MDNQCQLRFRRSSDEFLMREWERLLAMLDDFHLSSERDEVFRDLENSGKFTTRSLYTHISFGGVKNARVCEIWGVQGSFFFLAYHDRIQCGVQLKKKRWTGLRNVCFVTFMKQPTIYFFIALWQFSSGRSSGTV